MEDKKKHGIHNPVLNGSTKTMIFYVAIMIGAITLIALILFFILALEHEGFLNGWKELSVLGTFILTGLGFLGGMTKTFMDTRTTQEKDKTKLSKYETKMKYKTEKMKWKFKQQEIMKGSKDDK